MKIGVITHWWCYENYGQILQCFAYQHYLKSRGHNPFIIRFNPFAQPTDRLSFRRIISKLLAPKDVIRYFIYILNGEIRKKRIRREKIEKVRDFESFKKEYISYSIEKYLDLDSLNKSSEIEADLYSVGSDVVWKYVPLNDKGKVLFLNFGNKNATRIAYSPSFGVEQISEKFRKFVTPLLNQIDYIGVREISGVKICQELNRNDAICVLDPVFLVTRDEWMRKFLIPEHREGVFGYFLDVKGGVPVNEIMKLKKHDSFKVTTVYDDMNFLDEDLINPTVQEWIRLVGSSSMVVTNSFHCASMAIILHSPFIVFLRKGKDGLNTRITSILARLGLSERIYSPEKGSIETQMNKPIDWSSVDRLLEQEKKVSLEFLEKVGI